MMESPNANNNNNTRDYSTGPNVNYGGDNRDEDLHAHQFTIAEVRLLHRVSCREKTKGTCRDSEVA